MLIVVEVVIVVVVVAEAVVGIVVVVAAVVTVVVAAVVVTVVVVTATAAELVVVVVNWQSYSSSGAGDGRCRHCGTSSKIRNNKVINSSKFCISNAQVFFLTRVIHIV